MSLSYAQEVSEVSTEPVDIAKQLYAIADQSKGDPKLYQQVVGVTSRILECTDRLSRATQLSVRR